MADPKGYRLYVNTAASRARRRLKHFGHGVRKIHSAGRNQAVIIHTATGRNLEELESKFADVGYSSLALDEPIDNLRNLGSVSSDWLRDAGIRTIAELSKLGPVRVYLLVRQQHPQADLNLLWSLAAGLSNKDWRELDAEEKENLRVEIEENS